MKIQQIEEFSRISGISRPPGLIENGKFLSWNNTTKMFEYNSPTLVTINSKTKDGLVSKGSDGIPNQVWGLDGTNNPGWINIPTNITMVRAGRDSGTNEAVYGFSDGSEVRMSMGELAWLGTSEIDSRILTVVGDRQYPSTSALVSGQPITSTITQLDSNITNIALIVDSHTKDTSIHLDPATFPSKVYSLFNSVGSDVTYTYDPISKTIKSNISFANINTDSIREGSSNLYYTEDRVSQNTNVAQNTAKRHEHTNKAILDTISDAGSNSIITTQERLKLAGIEPQAQVNNITDNQARILTQAVNADSLHVHGKSGLPSEVAYIDRSNTFIGNQKVVGDLVITGNLIKQNVVDLDVHDNIITVNSGEKGAGVTARFSGIQFDRGTEADYAMVFDENDNSLRFGEFDSISGNVASVNSDKIGLGHGASGTDDEYNGMLIRFFKANEVSNVCTITDYDGTTNIATISPIVQNVDNTWNWRILVANTTGKVAIIKGSTTDGNMVYMVGDKIVSSVVKNSDAVKLINNSNATGLHKHDYSDIENTPVLPDFNNFYRKDEDIKAPNNSILVGSQVSSFLRTIRLTRSNVDSSAYRYIDLGVSDDCDYGYIRSSKAGYDVYSIAIGAGFLYHRFDTSNVMYKIYTERYKPTKVDVGLANVDNTSDIDKPISNSQQTALDTKVDKVTGKGLSSNDFTNEEKQKITDLKNNKANLNGDANEDFYVRKIAVTGKDNTDVLLGDGSTVKKDSLGKDVVDSLKLSAKNLLKQTDLLAWNSCKKIGFNEYTFDYNTLYGQYGSNNTLPNIYFKANTRYVISFDFKAEVSRVNGWYMDIRYSDGTSQTITQPNDVNFRHIEYITTESKTITSIGVDYGITTGGSTITIKNFSIIEANKPQIVGIADEDIDEKIENLGVRNLIPDSENVYIDNNKTFILIDKIPNNSNFSISFEDFVNNKVSEEIAVRAYPTVSDIGGYDLPRLNKNIKSKRYRSETEIQKIIIYATSSYDTTATANIKKIKLVKGDITNKEWQPSDGDFANRNGDSSEDFEAKNLTAQKIIKSGGTNEQILLADGSTANKSDLTVTPITHEEKLTGTAGSSPYTLELFFHKVGDTVTLTGRLHWDTTDAYALTGFYSIPDDFKFKNPSTGSGSAWDAGCYIEDVGSGVFHIRNAGTLAIVNNKLTMSTLINSDYSNVKPILSGKFSLTYNINQNKII